MCKSEGRNGGMQNTMLLTKHTVTFVSGFSTEEITYSLFTENSTVLYYSFCHNYG